MINLTYNMETLGMPPARRMFRHGFCLAEGSAETHIILLIRVTWDSRQFCGVFYVNFIITGHKKIPLLVIKTLLDLYVIFGVHLGVRPYMVEY